MAGASDEDENYWPGFVDALTTMTMVLTFVMMVLGVMVFMLSQDLSKAKLSPLAKVLKVESQEVDQMSEGDIEAALRKMAQERALEDPRPDASGNRPKDVGVAREVKAGGDGISGPPSPQADSPFQSPFEGGLIGDKAAGPGGEYLVSDAGRVAGTASGTGSRIQQGSGGLRFVFGRSALDLPPLGSEAIEAYVAAHGSGPMVVRATALLMEGGASEARRRAYFRAMLIRTRLVKAGVRPQDIEVQVRDQIEGATQEVVDITKRAG